MRGKEVLAKTQVICGAWYPCRGEFIRRQEERFTSISL